MVALIKPSSQLEKLVREFTLPPDLGFGKCLAPVMAKSHFNGQQWSPIELVPFAPLSLSPATKALHYGQLIFEGMKAFAVGGRGPFLFRPEDYGRRFQESAKRMGMPELPVELFVQGVASTVSAVSSLIPQNEGESLYIRPLMLADGEGVNLSPSKTFLFLVMVSPSASYFSAPKVKALIERVDCRAAPGGTGAAKTAGNYAASFRASAEASKLDFQQVLWLDAVEKSYIEEFSGMNFFARIGDRLVTPALTSTILPGVTRRSLITLARQRGVEVAEERLSISSIIASIKSGRCTEVFTCGTAAVITPLSALGEKDGSLYELPSPAPSGLWAQLRHDLVAVQTGLAPDPHGWRYPLA